MRSLALAYLCLIVSGLSAESQIISIERQEPRPFGYFLGDVVSFDILVTAERDFALDPASLPQIGPITYWLDLRSVKLDDEGGDPRRWRLRLSYQNFYAALDARSLKIPGFDLTFKSAGRSADAKIPAWSFEISPLREIQPAADDPKDFLRPDASPRHVSLASAERGLAALASLSALMLGLAAHDRAWPPFHLRRARPFTVAARRLEKMDRKGPADLQAALRTLHESIDAAAGRRLLAEDLDAFLAERPAYREEEGAFRRFFAASHRLFFAGDETGAAALCSMASLLPFTRHLAKIERAEG